MPVSYKDAGIFLYFGDTIWLIENDLLLCALKPALAMLFNKLLLVL